MYTKLNKFIKKWGLLLFLGLFLVPLGTQAASNLSARLSGHILLQVQDKGQAWYVYPENNSRYYLGRPADAFAVMRELGLGISDSDFNSFQSQAPSRLYGRILLKVQDKGQAYYVSPVDHKLHYLGRPNDAFSLMRSQGLGITDSDILQIPVASLSTSPASSSSTSSNQSASDNSSNNVNGPTSSNITFRIPDTGQTTFYSNNAVISEPSQGQPFYGEDAQYIQNTPSYTNNGDGTITDNVTGLMWAQDMSKMSYDNALAAAKNFRLGGYSDWRVPTIKELYSLIQYTGEVNGQQSIKPFIDTNYFNQPLGGTGTNVGDREIDAQTLSATKYTGYTMNKAATIFGVNFIDGRIKGYPEYKPGSGTPNEKYFRFVRGNTNYGKNEFVDNGDGTISDLATGLMWEKSDSGQAMDWQDALAYAQNLKTGGHTDWRLPNIKELESIVDYSRSPEYDNSPAIDPIFDISSITDPNGQKNWPYFWSSTTHLNGTNPYVYAAYVCFGMCEGKMNGVVMDVHGAGAQRSDPKSGNLSDYPKYLGPQGDIQYVFNYVRAVRNIK